MVEAIAYIGCIVLGGLALFQVALISGAPIGRFAWGGSHEILPLALRIASGSSIVLYACFVFILLSKANIIAGLGDSSFIAIVIWVIAAYFCLGVVMNALSRSRPERILMTPVASVLAIAFVYIAAH